jgi:isopenicillin-N N-acyltransferase-like protein
MRTHTFRGTHVQVGEQQGDIYARHGAVFGPVADRRLLRAQERAYRAHYPLFLDQCDGIARGGRYAPDTVRSALIAAPLASVRSDTQPRKGCTIFGVQAPHGVFVGRNYDWTATAERLCQAYRMRITEGYAHVGISDMYVLDEPGALHSKFLYEPEDAINERGLYVGITYAFDPAWRYGIAPLHMVQLVAETCGTVDEALALFARTPVCSAKNFFLADRTGAMAVVEHAARKFRIVKPKDGILIHTNNFLSPQLAKEDRVLEEHPQADTYIRYYEALQAIQGRRRFLTLGRIPRILWLPHAHLLERHAWMRTIWSLALDMKRRRYRLYSNIGRRKKREWLLHIPPSKKR